MVKGAKGEGLGKQFLGNIRNTNAIIRVLHCLEDDNIIHVVEYAISQSFENKRITKKHTFNDCYNKSYNYKSYPDNV
ncbi:MAG: hypothetical protein WKG06_25440 [Segetibacter sp.]